MDEEKYINEAEIDETESTDYRPVNRFDASVVHHLSGMYQNWFLDYASYVILERAVPHIEDGLKPVQRRILHSMKRMDDGRYNKVANIVGHTMQFHPHGDASIGDALVQLGQKDLLIDTQGNWGNILTGSSAAAPRYIEARLSKFALETVFNPKTTEWQMSYDGRNKEPITLPVKYPLLLAQGVEGIAVGLNSKIMPHNFCEICDAAIASLRGEEFRLYPDFPTGGSVDVSKYNDGQRGGTIKVRAKIEKLDNKTLVIRDIPFSKTSETLIESITKAVEKGKIKVRKVEDLTAANVEILIHLAPSVSSDKTIDALYAFTDCEISISPNCCVIKDKKPQFLKDVLFAGEVMPNKHLNYWRRHLPHCRYANLYGPTEITVDCTCYEVDREFADDEPLPIGVPCRNSDVLILVDQQREAAVGEEGELCVRGSSLALGYYNDWEKTRQAFIQNPLNKHYPETIYCTGDIVYRNERGEIMYVGRKDAQIKHNGYRIELGEIENAILATKLVDNCCATYDFTNKKIVLFYQAAGEVGKADFRKAVADKLPRYMIPTDSHHEEVLRQNGSGKIDRSYYKKLVNG